MDTLKEIVKPITGNKRILVLMRVAGLDTNLAMGLVGVSRGTYNSWFKNEEFNKIYHQIPDLIASYRDEAVQLLRRNNQLEAVLLEGKMLRKVKEELESGQLAFTRTHLAREVYSKLMTDLDKAPEKVGILSWHERVYQMLPGQKQIEGGTVDGEFEEVGVSETEHTKSDTPQDNKPRSDEAQA